MSRILAGVQKWLNGSVGTPGGRFRDDPDTGLYLPASNQIGIVGGGTEYVRVGGSNGCEVLSGALKTAANRIVSSDTQTIAASTFNDWNPGTLRETYYVGVTGGGTATITGLAIGQAAGWRVRITCTQGTLNFPFASASSTVGNRFASTSGGTVSISANSWVELDYISPAWRIVKLTA